MQTKPIDPNTVVQPPLPPLVALGPDSTDQLGIVPQDVPLRTLQAIGGLIDGSVVCLGKALEPMDGEHPAWFLLKQTLYTLKKAQALIGNQPNSVKTEPADDSEALSLVDRVISTLETVTHRTMPQTGDPRLLEEALEAQYQLRGVLTLGPCGDSEPEGAKIGRLGDEAAQRIGQLQKMAMEVHHG